MSSEQGVLQGFHLFPIFFLFYKADLIDICNSFDFPSMGIRFDDDENVLALGKSTGNSCYIMNEIRSHSFTWGGIKGAAVAPHKFFLVYFTKKLLNIPITPFDLPTCTLHPSLISDHKGMQKGLSLT